MRIASQMCLKSYSNSRSPSHRKYFLLAFLSAFLFSLSTPISKVLLEKFDPVFLASVFYFGAALILLPFSAKGFSRELSHVSRERADVFRLLGSSFFGGILGPISFLFGIKLMSATSASLLLNLEAVATTFIAWVFFREHCSKKVIFSSITTLIAGVLLVINDDFSLNFGGIFIAIACLSWALDNNLTASTEGISPATNTIVKGAVAGIINLILAFLLNQLPPFSFMIAVALLAGGILYGLSILLYITSARQLGAARSQIIFSLNPFFGTLFSYLIFFEFLNSRFFVGAILMIFSVLILFFERHVHTHVHDSIEHEHEHSHNDAHHNHTHEHTSGGHLHTHRHKHVLLKHAHGHYPDIHHKHRH